MNKEQEQYFNKIISTGGEISHLASILKDIDECNEEIICQQLSEWKMRKSLLIEKLKIVLDETEGYILQSMEDNEK